jgi:uncharacterized tellurite resistance protein B-like protein
MLKKLQKLLNNQNLDKESTKDSDINLTAAILMYEVARADDQIEVAELNAVKHFLAQDGIDPDNVDAIIKEAQTQSEDAISLHEFTREICNEYDNEQRYTLLVKLWGIAIADGNIDTYERHIIRKIASLLYLNDKQIATAKVVAQNNAL